MKLTYLQLIDLYEALSIISNLSEIPGNVSAKIVIDISSFILKVEDDVQSFYKGRQVLNKQYGTELANTSKNTQGKDVYVGTGGYYISSEHRDVYTEELNVLLERELEVPELDLEGQLDTIKDLPISTRVVILRALQK